MNRASAPAQWRLLTRQGCHLCDQMAAVLDRGLGPRGTAWIEVDVDEDAELRERFGETVPVLLRDGREHVAVLGHGHRRHLQLGGPVEHLADSARAVEQRVLGVQVQMEMYELRRHALIPTRSLREASS